MRKYILLSACLISAGCVSASSASKTVEMRVGQTRHVDAYRAKACGAPAPSFAELQARLPKSRIVQFSDGGLSSRNSDSCKRRVATRVVNGTGIAAGQEVHRFDNTVAIIVN